MIRRARVFLSTALRFCHIVTRILGSVDSRGRSRREVCYHRLCTLQNLDLRLPECSYFQIGHNGIWDKSVLEKNLLIRRYALRVLGVITSLNIAVLIICPNCVEPIPAEALHGGAAFFRVGSPSAQ